MLLSLASVTRQHRKVDTWHSNYAKNSQLVKRNMVMVNSVWKEASSTAL